jgi:hypothetical protein
MAVMMEVARIVNWVALERLIFATGGAYEFGGL